MHHMSDRRKVRYLCFGITSRLRWFTLRLATTPVKDQSGICRVMGSIYGFYLGVMIEQ